MRDERGADDRRTRRALGISGSTAAAPSPTSSAEGRTAACSPASCCRKIREAYRDAAVQGIRDLLGLAARRADPRRADRHREDGHHGRHQCAARAQGRAHAPPHHQGISRRAADRLPGAAEDFRPPDRQADDAVRARDRGRRARARRRHGGAGARSRCACAAQLQDALRRRHRGGRDRVHACLSVSGARAAGGRARPRARLPAGLGQPRGLAAHQARLPRRHHRGRRLSVADPAPLRGAGGAGRPRCGGVGCKQPPRERDPLPRPSPARGRGRCGKRRSNSLASCS